MLKNYFKIAFRNLFRNKTFSAINIFGLAVGIASCIVILLYVQYEFSFDKFNRDYGRVYRVCSNLNWSGEKMVTQITSANLGPALKESFPEVQNYARILNLSADKQLLRCDNKSFYEHGIIFADSSFFTIFGFHMLEGNGYLALSKPYSVVLTESMAVKYFGDRDPIGKTIELVRWDDKTFRFIVTGVMADPPSNSSLQFQFVVSFNTLYSREWGFQDINSWTQMSFETYVLLERNYPAKSFQARLPAFLKQEPGSREATQVMHTSLFLQPMKDIHLFSHFKFQSTSTGEVAHLYIYSAIAIFLLLIACVNFMNLSTARYARRTREIGVRKVIGAGRPQLLGQFLGESVLTSLAATVVAVVLVEISIPFLGSLLGTQLKFYLLSRTATPFVLLGIAVVTGLVAGIYPALFLASFRPTSILKGAVKSGGAGSIVRKSLVVFQFTISIALIVGTILVQRQMSYVRNVNLGFNKNNVVVIPLYYQGTAKRTAVYETEVRRDPDVVSTSAASDYPGVQSMSSVYKTPGKDAKPIWLNTVYADSGYLRTLGIGMNEGEMPTGHISTSDVVINQVAQKELGLKNAVGRELINGTEDGERLRIVGVIRNYNFQSLHNQIGPLVLRIAPPSFGYILCRINSRDYSSTLAFLKSKWAEINPGVPFDYSFLDADLNNLYTSEAKFGSAIDIFSGLAIIIACLGLFGLSAFRVEERTKEIGVRKVLGASVIGILRLLSKEFLGVVLVGSIIAWPVAYYFMQRWLHTFAYRTDMSIWIFLSAGGIALLIAATTVSMRAVKAATANPVESLRYE